MITKRTGPITAGELQAELQNNPAWLAMRRAKDEESEKRRAETRLEEAPILGELAANGVQVGFVSDLVNRRNDYSAILPILMKHLRMKYQDGTKEMLARAIAVPEAAPFWDELLMMYEHEPCLTVEGKTSKFKHGLAVTLSVLGKAYPEQVIRLCMNEANGPSRLLVIQAIRRIRRPFIDEALARLVRDPSFSAELSRWDRLNKRTPA